jgi:hypothetical protein
MSILLVGISGGALRRRLVGDLFLQGACLRVYLLYDITLMLVLNIINIVSVPARFILTTVTGFHSSKGRDNRSIG